MYCSRISGDVPPNDDETLEAENAIHNNDDDNELLLYWMLMMMTTMMIRILRMSLRSWTNLGRQRFLRTQRMFEQ